MSVGPATPTDFKCQPRSTAVGFCMFMAELIGTFTLCGVILSQKYNNNSPDTVKAFAVGLTLTCSILMIGGISGACINPAVGFAQTIFQSAMVKKATVAGGT